jgi:hypothetical protein
MEMMMNQPKNAGYQKTQEEKEERENLSVQDDTKRIVQDDDDDDGMAIVPTYEEKSLPRLVKRHSQPLRSQKNNRLSRQIYGLSLILLTFSHRVV